MRNLHNFMEEKHGKGISAHCRSGRDEKLRIHEYSSRGRFTLGCLSKDLIPVSARLKTMINTRRARQIIHKAERQLLQDRVQGMNDILWDNKIKLDRCRSRLSSIVTTTTMYRCT